MTDSLPQHDIVLLGAGHTNAHIVRMWRMHPIPGARLTCVSNFYQATYSGMLPGTLAGLYPPERMQIDLVRLCAAVGARLIVAEVTGLDPQARQLHFADRPPLPFDVLSIGIGSIPSQRDRLPRDSALVPIKPMQTFLPRLDRRLDELASLSPANGKRELQIVVVGAGVAGVEVAFCLPGRLRQKLGSRPYRITILDRGNQVASGLNDGARRLVERELERRGVDVQLGQAVRETRAGRLVLDNGHEMNSDLTLWSTGAEAPSLLAELGLPLDDRGFLRIHQTLQSVGCDSVFAVGDTASIEASPLPKAGVYAVRQGPVLWENLKRYLRREPLEEYVPQRGFLKLLSTGDGRAIMAYHGAAFHGRWCWRLKDWIDTRFMDKYQDYAPRPMAMTAQHAEAPRPMRCAGCGGKVGGGVLSNALRRLEIPPSGDVLLGLEAPDDAAIVRARAGSLVLTADFFTAPLDDPYLVGRIALLNSASDLFALGAQPIGALALATLPTGPAKKQEQLLYELMAGSLEELRRMGATLVGGHTIEGPHLAIGFSMFGSPSATAARTKASLRAGDLLVLTKPLGTGILLAAHMQARCAAPWYEPLVSSMSTSNQSAVALFDEFDIQGVTDITGFGLAGHLLEMLRASDLAAELDLDALPLLPGVIELSEQGIESTLAPANRAAEEGIDQAVSPVAGTEASRAGLERRARYAALFDPQTSGGLLLGVPEQYAAAVLDRLRMESDLPCAVIGRAVAGTGGARIRLTSRANSVLTR